MPGGALREYPGRDSNPQCPRGRTAFKAADFASLSTRAGVSASYGSAQGPWRGCREPEGESRLLAASSTVHTPGPDRRRVSRSLGWFYLCAPLVAEVWAAAGATRP